MPRRSCLATHFAHWGCLRPNCPACRRPYCPTGGKLPLSRIGCPLMLRRAPFWRGFFARFESLWRPVRQVGQGTCVGWRRGCTGCIHSGGGGFGHSAKPVPPGPGGIGAGLRERTASVGGLTTVCKPRPIGMRMHWCLAASCLACLRFCYSCVPGCTKRLVAQLGMEPSSPRFPRLQSRAPRVKGPSEGLQPGRFQEVNE